MSITRLARASLSMKGGGKGMDDSWVYLGHIIVIMMISGHHTPALDPGGLVHRTRRDDDPHAPVPVTSHRPASGIHQERNQKTRLQKGKMSLILKCSCY